jgi:hypothetical protein
MNQQGGQGGQGEGEGEAKGKEGQMADGAKEDQNDTDDN